MKFNVYIVNSMELFRMAVLSPKSDKQMPEPMNPKFTDAAIVVNVLLMRALTNAVLLLTEPLKTVILIEIHIF